MLLEHVARLERRQDDDAIHRLLEPEFRPRRGSSRGENRGERFSDRDVARRQARGERPADNREPEQDEQRAEGTATDPDPWQEGSSVLIYARLAHVGRHPAKSGISSGTVGRWSASSLQAGPTSPTWPL